MNAQNGRCLGRGWVISAVALLIFWYFVSPPFAHSEETSSLCPGDSRVSFIDSAFPGNQMRFRVDPNLDFHQPSKGEFLWAKSGAPFLPGPPRPETSVDTTDLSLYIETIISDCWSGFVELPVRFVDPEINHFNAGLADVNAGIKVMLCHTDDFLITFQFRGYLPTGGGRQGLGNDHFTVEPALLGCMPITDRLMLEGEFRTWVPLDGTDFAATHLRYGIGAYYDVYQSCDVRISPVVEVVSWTLLEGKVSPGVSSAGETIVNGHAGLRVSLPDRGDFYLGYGQALTDRKWYERTFRVEFRYFF